MKINVSMVFKGNCEEAIKFYAKVFEKEISMLSRFKDMPPSDEYKIDEKNLNKVMHSQLNISDNLVLMAVDDVFGMTNYGTNMNLSVNFTKDENLEEATRIFNELAEGGQITMPFQKTFWGAEYGKLIDKFGIGWEVNFQHE